MRRLIFLLVAVIAGSTSTFASDGPSEAFDWKQWQHLPVLDEGRNKPLDTLAWESLRTISNRASLSDPERGEKLGPTAAYLAQLLQWSGWDNAAGAHQAAAIYSTTAYPLLHEPDQWDRAPLIRIDFLALREALGVEQGQKHVSPLELAEATIQVPHSEKRVSFLAWAETLARRDREQRTSFEEKAFELAAKVWMYRRHRMGQGLAVLPSQEAGHEGWVSIAELMWSHFDETNDPTGYLREAKQHFQQARAAYLAGSPEQFNRASAEFIAAVTEAGPQLGSYPDQATIDLEVAYNHWAPFRYAWIFTLLAVVLLLLGIGSRWKAFYASGIVAFGAGVAAMCVGFVMRVAISGRAPVTNMYESVIYVALGVAVLGAILELVYRKRYILTAAAAVATVPLLLADNCPVVLDPSLSPLNPVLRSNFWLITHVMTITLSYAAFALALGIGNITLGYYLVGSKNRSAIRALSTFTYRTLQVGVLLLAAGTILGGVWADYSWGRFWGWDPKEVWALIALLGYLAVLHARYVGWVRDLGLAATSVVCFALVVMAWYGVNFILGTGLHSYGFGGGGQGYVGSVMALQVLYVVTAVVTGYSRQGLEVPIEQEPTVRSIDAERPGNSRPVVGESVS